MYSTNGEYRQGDILKCNIGLNCLQYSSIFSSHKLLSLLTNDARASLERIWMMVILLTKIWHDNFLSDDESREMWFQVIKHYLELGIDVDAEDENGYTALTMSLQHYEMLELLISYGADVNQVTSFGSSALMEAFTDVMESDTRSCVQLLLENGADPYALNEFGHNALVCAMENLEPNISDVRLLLEYHGDLDGLYRYLSSQGLLHDLPNSLLYIAYDFYNFEVAELCLQYGLDMTKQNWLLDTAHLPMGLTENDDLYKKLLHLYQNPLDLSVLARNKVRRSLGRRNISKTVAQLGLPKHLEDFVSCKW